VNNAGITRTAMLHKMTPEQWNQVVAVHLTGAFNCLQAVVGGMIERRTAASSTSPRPPACSAPSARSTTARPRPVSSA
jgi:NAD(P)-dependent dehydrogenase (short-subunit alcohol dehydrogenase family)